MSPSTLRTIGRRWIAAGALFGCAAVLSLAQTEEPPSGAVCSAYCSPEHAGLSVMELSWPLPESAVSPAEAKSLLARLTIDVTTYVDGFERQLYASVGELAAGKRFVAVARPAGAYGAENSLPGLQRLAITDVVTASAPAAASNLRLLTAPGIRTGTVVVRVSGLEGGMDYKWRLPAHSGGSVLLTCTAARCPVDVIEPARKPTPRPTRPKAASKH